MQAFQEANGKRVCIVNEYESNTKKYGYKKFVYQVNEKHSVKHVGIQRWCFLDVGKSCIPEPGRDPLLGLVHYS